jgi:hypothetical protein
MIRSLCAFGEESRHCQRPGERNVFSRGDKPPTEGSIYAPTSAPTGVDDLPPAFPDTCVSDGGDFGMTDPNAANQIMTVGFQYQVQTTIQLRAENLNNEVLAQLEQALSDLLVPPIFNGDELCIFDQPGNLQTSTSNLAPAVGLLSAPADRILLGSEGGTYITEIGCLEFTRV